MWKSAAASLSLFLLATPAVMAQNASDLYMVPITGEGDGVEVGTPVRLTDRDGYDNQPSFSPDGMKVYYTSMRGEQSDLWAVPVNAMKAGEPYSLFETAESEYSPTPIPGEQALSAVRVEADETQRLWRFPLDGTEPSVILPSIKPVGYHAWWGQELVLFVLDEPHRLVRVATENQAQARTVASDIGRALGRIPGEDAFSFVLKASDGRAKGWQLTRLGATDDALSILVPTLEGREDMAWSPDGSAWAADGTRLMRWRRGEKQWREVADLGGHGISGITRLAFDAKGSRLALVASRQPAKVNQLDIVDLAIERHGGSRFTASETSLKVCSRSGCFDVDAQVDGDNFLFDVRGKSRDKNQRVQIGNDSVELWHDDSPVSVATADQQRLRDWAMARVYFPFLPFRLNDASVYKQDLGLETWNGRPLHKVRVTFEPGSSTDADDVYLHWFDPESGQLVQFAYSYVGNPGGIRFRQLTNERRIGGILFHDQKNLGAEGEGLTVERLTPESIHSLRHVSTVKLRDISVRDISVRELKVP